MLSDTEILAVVQRHWLLMREGKRSSDTAGADCFRELRELAASEADPLRGPQHRPLMAKDVCTCGLSGAHACDDLPGLEHG